MAANNSRLLKIFLCHAKEDKVEVRALYGWLRECGFAPWLDEQDLLPGEDWRTEIPRAVHDSDVVLACLSNRAVAKRGFVQKEIVCALDAADEQPEGSLFIIPTLLEDCKVPERLKRWQWVNLSSSDGHEKIIQALNNRATSLGKRKALKEHHLRSRVANVRTQYIRSDRVNIAYQVWGEGDVDILLIHGGFIPIQAMHDQPRFARFLNRLVNLGRLIIFDCRGIGCSDPISLTNPPTVEQWAQDALAILDAVKSQTTIIIGNDLGGAAAAVLAAHNTGRVRALILFNAYARLTRSLSYSLGQTLQEQKRQRAWVDEIWSGRDEDVLKLLGPSVADDPSFVKWWRQATFHGASPGVAGAFDDMVQRCDVRKDLSLITAPTLVLQRGGSKYVAPKYGQYLATHIAGAEYVELLGNDHWIYAGNTDAVISEIARFIRHILPTKC